MCLCTWLLVLWDIVTCRGNFARERPIEEDSMAHRSAYPHRGEALHLLAATHRH